MTFRWTDRAGVEHDLVDHHAIEQERQQVRAELLGLRAELANTNDDAFMVAYGEAQPLRARIDVLRDDLRNFVRYEAARATKMIGEIDLAGSFIDQLHRSYDQHAQCDQDDLALDGSPTPEQIAVLKRQAIRDGRSAHIPATFREAHAMLLAHPDTCRTPLPPNEPAFEWTDRRMHYHEVRDLRQIEREYLELAGELALLAPQLATDAPLDGVLAALGRGRLAIDRVTILQRAMNRWSAHVIGVVRGEYLTFLDNLES